MSIKISSEIWVYGPTSSKEKMLLLAIADHANDAGYAFPGLALLARKVCGSERTVIRQLEKLQNDGWLRIEHKAAGASRQGNAYFVNLEKLGLYEAEKVQVVAVEVSRHASWGHQGALIDAHLQVTDLKVQVTKSARSGDKSSLHILSNHHESSSEPSRERQPLVRPSQSRLHDVAATELATAMFDRLAIVAPQKTIWAAAQAIRLATREYTSMAAAADVIEQRARRALEAGTTVNVFWFEDGKWKQQKRTAASVGMHETEQNNSGELRESLKVSPNEAQQGHVIWQSMRLQMKRNLPIQVFKTWIYPVRAAGVIEGELYLSLPSDCFNGVIEKHGVQAYLPESITEIKCSIERDEAD